MLREERHLRREEPVQPGCLVALAISEIIEAVNARLGGGLLRESRLRKQARASYGLD
jgi:hypothetical protein